MVFMELSPLWYTLVFILLFVWKALKKLQAHQILLGALDLLLQVVQILEFPKLQAAQGGRWINGRSSTWISMTNVMMLWVILGGTLKEVMFHVKCTIFQPLRLEDRTPILGGTSGAFFRPKRRRISRPWKCDLVEPNNSSTHQEVEH